MVPSSDPSTEYDLLIGVGGIGRGGGTTANDKIRAFAGAASTLPRFSAACVRTEALAPSEYAIGDNAYAATAL